MQSCMNYTCSYTITNGQLASLWVPWPTLALLITPYSYWPLYVYQLDPGFPCSFLVKLRRSYYTIATLVPRPRDVILLIFNLAVKTGLLLWIAQWLLLYPSWTPWTHSVYFLQAKISKTRQYCLTLCIDWLFVSTGNITHKLCKYSPLTPKGTTTHSFRDLIYMSNGSYPCRLYACWCL